ncbi:DNA topoisomerase IV subunit A [Mycoplasma procyoni]|uniref:DNA topoisomerase IV subunit A n=1 Tax=Mycoplasma procyoni TaxID=568784 RepID=UPI00197BDDB8|nr:DNA topoisomerase IV subunit A [Mycoplasma procyoni]MBN3535049.1 DNA topoisomerase IV subunit A [Mycoplasma procyoni]
MKEKFLEKSLDLIFSDRFGRYSKYIIQQRALPDARDGLKPVQRRILYSMWELGLKSDKPFKKSARVVGDVIGKYHPHGDSSIYEALVRMGQEWKMNVPLVEMHGNKGSIDDDPAAAMRYTEARLAKVANLMLEAIDKNTTTFIPNFDDSETEPMVLPTLIPNLLVNGVIGIASGFATDIPPHNLNEVLDAAIAKIKNPAMEIRKLANIIKGPDYPTGGTIYGRQGILDAFEKGQGKVVLVSKYKVVDTDKQKSIEIYEIPFGVVKSKLVKDIDEIRIDKKIPGIKEVRDQSDRNGISIMIELEDDAKVNAILNYLLQKTQMQINHNYNSTAIKNNAPKLMSLNDMLESYLSHVKDFKQKELKFDLDKDETKLEITLALIRVGDITDEVIRIIRNSDNSKKGVIQALMKEFDFSEVQATAIAEMRLYKLSRIDQQTYINERDLLEDRIKKLKNLLSDEGAFNNYLIDILKQIKKEFGTERKTEIVEDTFKIEIKEEELIRSEECYVGISRDGYIKRFSTKTYESNSIETYALKEGDPLLFLAKVNTLNKILVFINSGNYVLLPVHKLEETKWKDVGIHLNSFVSLKSDEKVVSVVNVKDFGAKEYITLVTEQGIGKRVLVKDFEVSRTNKTYTAIKLKAGKDLLVNAKVSDNFKDIVIVHSEGKAVKYSEIDIPIYNTNSSGVKVVSLPKDAKVEAFNLIDKKDELVLFTKKAQFKKINEKDLSYSQKTTQGKQLFAQNKVNKIETLDLITTSNQNQICIFDLENKISQFDLNSINTTTVDEGYSNSKNKLSFFVSDLKPQVIGVDSTEVSEPKMQQKPVFSENNSQQKQQTKSENKSKPKDKEIAKKEPLINSFEQQKETKETQKEKEQKRIKSAEEKLKSLDELDIDSLIKKFKDKIK